MNRDETVAALHAEADAWERMAAEAPDAGVRASRRRTAREYRRRAIRLSGSEQ